MTELRVIRTPELVKCWKDCPFSHACVRKFDPKIETKCIENLTEQFGAAVDVSVVGHLDPFVQIKNDEGIFAKFYNEVVYPI